MKDNIIFIGKKPSLAYVLETVTQLNEAKNVTLKARGKSISKAVDVAEIVRKFYKNAKTEIKIGTDSVLGSKEKMNISTIEILIKN